MEIVMQHPCSTFFFFNDTATTEIYTLSLHDALPISFFEALDLRRIAAPLDAYGVEGIASAGAHSALVEDMGNFGIGILIQKTVDILEDVLVSRAHLRGVRGPRQRQCCRGAAAKANRR